MSECVDALHAGDLPHLEHLLVRLKAVQTAVIEGQTGILR